MNLTKFGSFIVSLREESGITQVELAKKIGVKPKLIAMWEKGICPPKADKISDLASALCVQKTELLLSKCLPTSSKSENFTEEALNVYEEIVSFQMRTEAKYRRLREIFISILVIILGVFLIDSISLVLFIFVIGPILSIFCFLSSVLFYCAFRHTNKKTCRPIIEGMVSLLVFISIMSLITFAFFFGGPVPT